jgi:hypothetical protein
MTTTTEAPRQLVIETLDDGAKLVAQNLALFAVAAGLQRHEIAAALARWMRAAAALMREERPDFDPDQIKLLAALTAQAACECLPVLEFRFGETSAPKN